MNGEIHLIPVQDLRPGPWQPRRFFDEVDLTELAISIREQGVLTPLRVVPSSGGIGYLIVAGERRWRAAGLAGISELPCMVMPGQENDGTNMLREVAILDNLHRANLRPGEEARAVLDLSRLGMTQREIAQRLGKTVSWVSQRQMMAKLPAEALEKLDKGDITRHEGIALCKLLDYPDLVAASLEPDGRKLAMRLGGYVPSGVGERVQAIMRVLSLERQRKDWAIRMRRDGHRVLDEPPREGDKRFVRLLPGSDLARLHQEARLTCDAWVWESGHPVRYCTDAMSLQAFAASARSRDPVEQQRQKAHQRVLEREASRDAIITAWLATSRNVGTKELAMLARERIRTLTATDDRLLSRLGGWLDATGDRANRAGVAEREIANAGEGRLIQLWFLLEAAQTLSYSVVPQWLSPWLESLGFTDSPQSVRGSSQVPESLSEDNRANDVEGK